MDTIYDVIIVGAGPAGLTAGLYLARAKLNTLIVEKQTLGGELMERDLIENYPGYPGGISGPDLGSKMINQVMELGVMVRLAEAQQILDKASYKMVKTNLGDFEGRAIIIAGGAQPKKLNIPGEREFQKRGVFYCATCDGPHFANKVVAVAGGGNSGVTEGLFLSKFVSKVIIIEALPCLSATKVLQERIYTKPNIEIRCGVKIEAIQGDTRVESLSLLDIKAGVRSNLGVDGVLVHIGVEPDTYYLKEVTPLSNTKQVVVNKFMEAQVEGVFAAGDIRSDSPMQIATAVGDGAIAAITAQKFLVSLAN